MFPGLAGAKIAAETLYVEDVFSAYTDVGTGASLAQVNGIDLAAKGGMVWIKGRSGATNNAIYDTVRGATFDLVTNLLTAQTTESQGVTAFNSNGFTRGTLAKLNTSTATYVSWVFRKAAKFFDVVSWTGNGANRTLSHSLGVAPGMIIVKCSSNGSTEWRVYHRSLANTEYLTLNSTSAKGSDATCWNSTTATSTTFSLGTNTDVNQSTRTFVAYLFAHDTASDGIIQHGSYVGNASAAGPVVTLGWEPQYVFIKNVTSATDWAIFDTARGLDLGASDKLLSANLASAETSAEYLQTTATGFQIMTTSTTVNQSANTYVYMAIRKGLMRPPTDATKVFAINARTGTGAAATVTAGSITQGVDLSISKTRNGANYPAWMDRLRGSGVYLASSGAAADAAVANAITSFNMDSVTVGTDATAAIINDGGSTYINYFLKQARGFFDEVPYTGTGAAHTEAHNLGVVPELMIVRRRGVVGGNWVVYYGVNTNRLLLEDVGATAASSGVWNDTSPTASVFTIGTGTAVNASGGTYFALLFATLAGVSKVGTYTGTGTTKQINCGFAAGARFVLIKRIDSTGDWYFWDTTRGIVSGNDPYLLLNSTAAEVTSTDYIDPYSAGFELSSTAPAALNASGGTYLFLAIA